MFLRVAIKCVHLYYSKLPTSVSKTVSVLISDELCVGRCESGRKRRLWNEAKNVERLATRGKVKNYDNEGVSQNKHENSNTVSQDAVSFTRKHNHRFQFQV